MNFFKKLFKNKSDNNDSTEIDKKRLPVHIAIIMDGNGRWAKKRNLPKNFGHKEGGNTLKKVVTYCGNLGIKYLLYMHFQLRTGTDPKMKWMHLWIFFWIIFTNAEHELSARM
jgi:undecaprenyl diphosphate synthase